MAPSLTEVVLIISMGFSPGSANHTSMQTLEYVQESMEVCKTQMANGRSGGFHLLMLCVERKIKQ